MSVESVDPADCGSYELHRTHNWRSGFLWRTKNNCRGTSYPRDWFELPDDFVPPSAALVPMTIVDHKHDYKLQKAFRFGPKQESDLLWLCDWFGCNHYFVTDRNLWWTKGVWYDLPVSTNA
jgi:hypothetical protein